METGLHKPRFKLFELIALVVVVAVVLAILPGSVSPLAAGLIVVIALLRSVTDRITLIEWLVIAAIGCVLVALLLPAVRTDHSHRKRMNRPASPTTPPPAPINPTYRRIPAPGGLATWSDQGR